MRKDKKKSTAHVTTLTFNRTEVLNEGDCLYLSILELRSDFPSVQDLRYATASHLETFLKENHGFFVADEFGRYALLGDRTLEAYQQSIRTDLWGGDLEIKLLVEILHSDIFTVSNGVLTRYAFSGADPKSPLFIESDETGAHFNALVLDAEYPDVDFSTLPPGIVDPDRFTAIVLAAESKTAQPVFFSAPYVDGASGFFASDFSQTGNRAPASSRRGSLDVQVDGHTARSLASSLHCFNQSFSAVGAFSPQKLSFSNDSSDSEVEEMGADAAAGGLDVADPQDSPSLNDRKVYTFR
jgi:hypothetical protein